MKYSNERIEYPDLADAEFFNARTVKAGNIPSGILYRSSSAVQQRHPARFLCVGIFATRKGKGRTQPRRFRGENAVLQRDIPPLQPFALERRLTVILCPPEGGSHGRRLQHLSSDRSPETAPVPPSSLRCTFHGGKECAPGYICALLEGLCGATYEEIVADYLVTYDNYYDINPAKKTPFSATPWYRCDSTHA